MIEANYDEVICPKCVHQFRAIPVNVQTELREMEKQIEKLVIDRHTLMVALDKIARLGNEPYYGNSDGNMIARAAIQKVNHD